MSDALYRHYENELQFIRQMARDFAKRYPGPASRLQLKDNESTDPHVERLIEAFALIAGRIRLKLDDEFPELTDALLGVLYPHYLAPIPSMAIVQFELDVARNQAANGFLIDRHSMLHTPPVRTRWEDGLQVKFRTAYPVTLWPVETAAARLQPPPFGAGLQAPPRTVAALRLTLACRGDMKFSELSLETLRFYLHGGEQQIAVLYELLFNHALQVVIRPLASGNQPPLFLNPGDCIAPVGFEKDEALLPYPNRSFPGYRLLTEFFTFPAKFHFFDLTGWERIRRANFGDKLEVVIFLDRTETGLEHSVDASTFCLGCTPIVNLFEQTAEGIDLAHEESEYLVKADVAHRRGMEIYSIDSVTSVDPGSGETTEYQPFYSFRHGSSREKNRTFWHPTRKPSLQEDDRGTEVYLSLVDLGFDPRKPPTEALVVRTTCTNRDLPVDLLQAMGEELYLELEAGAPTQRIRCLKAPSAPLRPPTRRGAHWRLISHLSLNHLSIADEEEGRLALQEILRLYDFSDPETGQQRSAVTRDLIDGITSVRSRRVVGRVGPPEVAGGFCRGIEVTVEFDERKYVGTGAYLFASVLDRFLGLYASMNSFTQVVAVVQQREGILKKWPPRAGEHPLL